MAILSTSGKKEDTILVGAYMPPWVNDYLTLYVLAYQTTKSNVIREITLPWFSKKKKEHTEEDLMQKIIQHTTMRWKEKKAHHRNVSFIKYKNDLSKELFKKGLLEAQVYKIISEIKE